MSRDALVLKIQRQLCHLKCARKVSALSRNRPQLPNLTATLPLTLLLDFFPRINTLTFRCESSLWFLSHKEMVL